MSGTSRRKSAGKKQNPRRKSKRRSGRPLWDAFARSRGGKLFFAALGTLIVVLLDILISRNQFDLFFLLLGIELLIAFAVILLILAWQQNDVDSGK